MLDGYDQLLSFALSTHQAVCCWWILAILNLKKIWNAENRTRARWVRSKNAIHSFQSLLHFLDVLKNDSNVVCFANRRSKMILKNLSNSKIRKISFCMRLCFFWFSGKMRLEKNNGPVFVFLKKPNLWKNSSMIVRTGFYSPILHMSKNSFWLFLRS